MAWIFLFFSLRIHTPVDVLCCDLPPIHIYIHLTQVYSHVFTWLTLSTHFLLVFDITGSIIHLHFISSSTSFLPLFLFPIVSLFLPSLAQAFYSYIDTYMLLHTYFTLLL